MKVLEKDEKNIQNRGANCLKLRKHKARKIVRKKKNASKPSSNNRPAAFYRHFEANAGKRIDIFDI